MMKQIEKVRYGIVGFGLFAEKAIAPAVRAAPRSELVALQKRSRAEASAKAREHAIPLAFDSVHELVRHADVDAVFIVSANSCHCSETVTAAEAGKHVIVEKPMAMNAAEAQRMIDVCAKNRVKLMVGHMVRLSPLVRRLKELVQSGTLGRITLARADFVYDARLSHRRWLFERAVAGGGPVFDIGVHCLDALRFIMQDEVVSVKSELMPLPSDVKTEASAQLLLRFSRETVGSIYCSFEGPYRRSLIEITGTQGIVTAVDFTVSNSKASLAITRDRGGLPGGQTLEEFQVPNLYVEEVAEFSRCILSGGEPSLSGSNGLENQLVLDEAMKVVVQQRGR